MTPPSSRGLPLSLLLAGLAVILLLGGIVVPAAGTTQTEPPLSVNSSMTVELQIDGDARWTVSTTFNLTDQNSTEAYQDFAAAFERGEDPIRYIDSSGSVLGIESFERSAVAANEHTDREMTIQNRQRSTASQPEVANGTGRVTIEFTWTNFARADEGTLVVDDVLLTSAGDLWLEGLSDSQSLTVIAPPEYGVRDSADGVSPQEGELRWEGPEEFTEQSLQVTLIGPNSASDSPLISQVLMFGALPVAIIALVVVLYMGQVGKISISIPPVRQSSPQGGSTETNSQPAPDPDPDPDPANEEIDEDLLSDEERIERLLSMNGGRMKQANIVKENDWSNAKVSQLLSSMEDEGQIDKLRIGRENLISFPDENITESNE